MRHYLEGVKYGTPYTVFYGIDHVTGFFITIQRNDELVNYSQFYPYNERFTKETLKELKRILKREDIEKVLNHSIEETWLYFNNVVMSEVNYITTIRQWLTAFNNHEQFEKAIVFIGHASSFEIYNDNLVQGAI